MTANASRDFEVKFKFIKTRHTVKHLEHPCAMKQLKYYQYMDTRDGGDTPEIHLYTASPACDRDASLLEALNDSTLAVKTSDIKEIHVITVARGEDVTMKCSISSAAKKYDAVWYRQISGKLPQFIGKPYKSDLGYKFIDVFNDTRSSISVNDNKFDLSIKKTREDDEREYFCGEMDGNVVKFTSGTRLQFNETTHRPTSGTTHRDSSSSRGTSEMRVFFWLSISRIGVLSITVIILTIWYKVLKSRS
ncbi:uncharacterized protein LOC132842413 [Tachysurus vachellii]|uniref:uncharacterized protein LOC132842413 n=1 Tax=Tachysurus vachellii TaxID=175792 RepID=UPI00296AA2D4|nr:uncharacterized protein LOC132842413 [Tachysurus vachellii]